MDKGKTALFPASSLRWFFMDLARCCACLLMIAAVLAFLPIFPGGGVYHGVGPALGLRQSTRGKSKEFLLEEGNLYLLRQERWHGLLLTTYVRHVKWSEPDLRRLRERFPELQKNSLWEEMPQK